MLLTELFISFFQIGLFSIGGGYAALPLIQSQVVDKHGWLSMTAFADILTISQMTPGPIAINAATFVGTKIAGLPGAIVATAGCISPSIIIVLFLAYIYYKYRNLKAIQGILMGLRPGVVALIGSAGVSILLLAFLGESQTFTGLGSIDYVAVILFIMSMIGLRNFKMNPITVMVGSGLVGMCIYMIMP